MQVTLLSDAHASQYWNHFKKSVSVCGLASGEMRDALWTSETFFFVLYLSLLLFKRLLSCSLSPRGGEGQKEKVMRAMLAVLLYDLLHLFLFSFPSTLPRLKKKKVFCFLLKKFVLSTARILCLSQLLSLLFLFLFNTADCFSFFLFSFFSLYFGNRFVF